ncbi:TPA: glycosyltransferase [Vibrio vulnificus]|nr:glycosyltransferase family 4 protein [Vibrio vulnificus]HAS6153514.1 glycosyltransferase [Vibrio vulnificus]
MTIVFCGPSLKPYTGQSLAFDSISEGFDGNKIIIRYSNEGDSTYSKLAKNLKFLIEYLFLIARRFRVLDTLYITTSRSFLGFLRDFFIINISCLFGLRIINHLHGADFKIFFYASNCILRFFIFHTYKKIHTSIVLLEDMKEQYDMFPHMAIDVVPNFFKESNTKFSPKVRSSSKRLKILYLSNLMATKGILELSQAIRQLSEEGVDIELTVAGKFLDDSKMTSSEIENEFESICCGCESINYVGTVYGEKKEFLLFESDVFCLPTYYQTEAQPISIIEAMAARCAIIATNHNYLPSMLNEKNGFLVEPRSINAIKVALMKFYNDRKLLDEVGAFNYKYSREMYSESEYIRALSLIISREA